MLTSVAYALSYCDYARISGMILVSHNEVGILLEPASNKLWLDMKLRLNQSYALSWKPCQGDSLNLPDHRSKITKHDRKKSLNVEQMNKDLQELNDKCNLIDLMKCMCKPRPMEACVTPWYSGGKVDVECAE
ncbi:hypothetical protein Tco_0718950 [Tanacetum coccineum]